MSLNDVISKAAASRLADVEIDDLVVLVRALSLGFPPSELHAGIQRVAEGDTVPLPSNLGAPRPLKINAWSFVNDRGQYADTYGLSDADAGRLKGLMRDEPEAGVKEIMGLVSTALRTRGSNRAVHVSREGLPGTTKGDQGSMPGKQGGADLKAEIIRNPTVYGMYTFVPEDTGRPGPYRFRVSLGSGLYAVFPSKRGAVDVARICRVKGRDDPVIAGRVVFWRNGKPPVTGSDIPKQVTFDGRLKPGETQPHDPVEKAETTV